MTDKEIDALRQTDLLSRIAAQHRNHATSAKFMLAEVTRLVGQVETWRQRIDHLTDRQMAAMLHVTTKMLADVQVMRALAKDRDTEQWETLETQAQVLAGIVEDVTERLRAIGADMDTVLTELKPVEMADIMLNQSLNSLAIINDAEVRAYQISADFPGLVAYLTHSEPLAIVGALLQIPNNKAVEVLRLLAKAEGDQ